MKLLDDAYQYKYCVYNYDDVYYVTLQRVEADIRTICVLYT